MTLTDNFPKTPALKALSDTQLTYDKNGPLLAIMRLALDKASSDKVRNDIIQRFVNAARVHSKHTRNGRELDEMFGIAYLIAAHKYEDALRVVKVAQGAGLMGPVYRAWAGRGLSVSMADKNGEYSAARFKASNAESRHIVEAIALSRQIALNELVENHVGGLISEQFELIEKPVRILSDAILGTAEHKTRHSSSWIAGILEQHREEYFKLKAERIPTHHGRIPSTMGHVYALPYRVS